MKKYQKEKTGKLKTADIQKSNFLQKNTMRFSFDQKELVLLRIYNSSDMYFLCFR